jgi:hypothetical protein
MAYQEMDKYENLKPCPMVWHLRQNINGPFSAYHKEGVDAFAKYIEQRIDELLIDEIRCETGLDKRPDNV